MLWCRHRKVGGNAYANIRYVVPATAYQNEVVNPATNTTDNATTYSAKIGLMYASDYGFCAVPEAWTTTLYNYDGSVNGATIRSQNWMHMGNFEWTISRISDISNYAFRVRSAGRVGSHGVSEYFHGVRPTFFLETYSHLCLRNRNPIRPNNYKLKKHVSTKKGWHIYFYMVI